MPTPEPAPPDNIIALPQPSRAERKQRCNICPAKTIPEIVALPPSSIVPRSAMIAALGHRKAEWTKNRRPGFQPLPHEMVETLTSHIQGKAPSAPLCYVAKDTSRCFQRDLQTAGIPRDLNGKLDFHALRVAYITFLCESGADIKTVQTLARHANPAMTMNTYAQSRQESQSAAAAAIGQTVLGQKCSAGVIAKAVGSHLIPTTTGHSTHNENLKKRSVRDSNPISIPPDTIQLPIIKSSQTNTNTATFETSIRQPDLPTSIIIHPSNIQDSSKQHEKCSAGVIVFPPDLQAVIDRWAALPSDIRAAIGLLVRANQEGK